MFSREPNLQSNWTNWYRSQGQLQCWHAKARWSRANRCKRNHSDAQTNRVRCNKLDGRIWKPQKGANSESRSSLHAYLLGRAESRLRVPDSPQGLSTAVRSAGSRGEREPHVRRGRRPAPDHPCAFAAVVQGDAHASPHCGATPTWKMPGRDGTDDALTEFSRPTGAAAKGEPEGPSVPTVGCGTQPSNALGLPRYRTLSEAKTCVLFRSGSPNHHC